MVWLYITKENLVEKKKTILIDCFNINANTKIFRAGNNTLKYGLNYCFVLTVIICRENNFDNIFGLTLIVVVCALEDNLLMGSQLSYSCCLIFFSIRIYTKC